MVPAPARRFARGRRFGVTGSRQGGIAHVCAGVAGCLNDGDQRARQVSIEQKVHVSARQREVALRFHEFRHISQSGLDVLGRDVIFGGDLLEGHAAGGAAGDDGDWHAYSADDGSSVTDGRIDCDAFGGGCGSPKAILGGFRAVVSGCGRRKTKEFTTKNTEGTRTRISSAEGNRQDAFGIDAGGQGVVYRARSRDTGQIVALKLLLDGRLASERQRRRFRREIELAARLRHPNIVPVLDSGMVRGRHYYVMEFIEGVSISDYVLLNDLAPREIVGLLISVCHAIDYAHQHGVLHRDVNCPASGKVNGCLRCVPAN